MRRLLLIASSVALSACAPATQVSMPSRPVTAPTDGRGVLGAMHARYVGKFYTSLSFSQNTTNISQSGREIKGVWNEYIVVPGKLRIDYLPLSSRSGVLYTGGRVYVFAEGRAQPAQAGWNPLAILIADVYAQPVDTTVVQLDSLGFDVSTIREDRWQTRKVWVVGARVGDSTSSQFWIDHDSLLVRRVIQKETRAGRTTVTDIRFYRYQDVGGYPVAFDVHFFRDGRLYFKEEYFDVKTNVPIPPEVFDPAKWAVSQVKRASG
ncbi:MAG: LolA family protein [Gemmatimonadaceae bacterium]